MADYKLIVESGTDQGKTFAVKTEGFSIGRSNQNDVVIHDELLSRHHCKIYFRGAEPWLSDLATLNGTQVNGAPVKDDVKLAPGDTISVGDTAIRFTETQGIPASAPDIAAPSTESAPNVSNKIDLGFSNVDAANDGKASESLKKTIIRAVIAFVAICTVAIAIKIMSGERDGKDTQPVAIQEPVDQSLEIHYTKVQGTDSNVFRYQMDLAADGLLTVSIDDLNQGKHVSKTSENPISQEIKQDLIRKFGRAGFSTLDSAYEGIPLQNTWNVMTLTATVSGSANTVTVRNRIEPEAFKTLREDLETFGRNELGLWAIEFSREKLLELANENLLVARKLYDEREIRRENLYTSIRTYKSCLAYLETLEPKPEFYNEAVSSLETATRDLETIYKEKNWQADHSINTKDWDKAAQTLRELMEFIPDRADERNRETERRLLDVESRIEKLRK